jgi:hypothetical protein
MMYQSTVLLENVSNEDSIGSYNFTEKQPGAGYKGLVDTTTTVQYQFNEFVGEVKLQGTLELYPGDADWFDIGETLIDADSTVITDSYTASFTGNIVWVRAAYSIQNGTITQIRYNL